ncbi:MAG: TonB family protein [Candidatus Aminicenantes bacterium]|nr:MAG: TonB family protein [Candidatus Aminicenantes bacterium]
MKKFLIVFLGLIILGGNLLLPHEPSQKIDPFYLKRLEKGEQAFQAGNIEKAVEELEIALFGLGGNKEARAKACLYLGLSHHILKNNQKAEEYLSEAKNLVDMEELRNLISDESMWQYLNNVMAKFNLLGPSAKQPAAPQNRPKPFPQSRIINPRETDIARNLEQRIKLNPQDTGPYYELYEYHQEKNDTRAAKNVLESLIRRNPSEAKGYYLLGRIQYEQRKFKEAEKSFSRVFELQKIVAIEKQAVLEAIAYQILALHLQGDRKASTRMFALRSDQMSEENIRFLDLNEQDRSIFMGIAQNEATRSEIVKLRDQGLIGSGAGQTSREGGTQSNDPSRTSSELSGELEVGDLIPLNEVDFLPILEKKVDPKYPPSAKALGIEGQVTVNALISENGDIVEVVIIQGLVGGFNNATVNAVMQWKYSPAIKDGLKVKTWKPITITFKAR